jgi:hypothetical protein
MTVYIWCVIAMLFTCALVLSCAGGKRGYVCETWIVGTISKILGGPGLTRKIHVVESWQEVQSNPGTNPWRMYLRGASEDGRYVQSLWVHNCARKKLSSSCLRCITHAWLCCPWLSMFVCPDFFTILIGRREQVPCKLVANILLSVTIR